MRHVNSEVENLKALIDNQFTSIRRSTEDLNRTSFITNNMSLTFERRGGLSNKRKYN